MVRYFNCFNIIHKGIVEINQNLGFISYAYPDTLLSYSYNINSSILLVQNCSMNYTSLNKNSTTLYSTKIAKSNQIP